VNQADSPIYQKLKPQTKDEFAKVQDLEKLLVEYILVRFVEEASEEEIEKLNNSNFSNLVELSEELKRIFPDFQKKYTSFTSEFMEKYV
jgi:hypothetical protein